MRAKKIHVTGSAGFVGFHFVKRLSEEGYDVLGIDSLSNYYDVKLKLSRNKILMESKNFSFLKCDLQDYPIVSQQIKSFNPQ